MPSPRSPRSSPNAAVQTAHAAATAGPSGSGGVELLWPGKYDAAGARRLPTAVDATKREIIRRVGPAGSACRLIHGDFRCVLPDVAPGSIDFIYVDPPFRTRRDHYLKSKRGEAEKGDADQSARPQAAYSDRWEAGAYLDFLDDLIALSRPALRETGSIALHVDHRAAAHARCLLDEHFGAGRFINELIWKYGLGNATAARHFLRKHDTILVYGKSSAYYFRRQRGDITPAQKGKYCHEDERGRYMISYGKRYDFKGGKPLESVLDIPAIAATDAQRCGYPTQKPLRLLEVLIESLCPADGVVMDPCCGSGTTAVAAQRSGRPWLACDASEAAIELATQRLEGQEGGAFVVERVG